MNKEKLVSLIADETKDLLAKHYGEIETALVKMGREESLSISMSHKLTQETPKKVKIETSLNFVIDRVKDNREYSLNEQQPGLFEEKEKEKKGGKKK